MVTTTVQHSGPTEAVINYLPAVGIRGRIRTMGRPVWLTAWKEKKIRGMGFCGAGGFGNAVTRIENYFISSGMYAGVNHPAIDELFRKQEVGTDVSKREAMLLDIQRLAYERALFVPLYAWVWHAGVGPRVEEASLGKIPLFYYRARSRTCG